MTNKEMKKIVDLLCEGETVRFGRYLIKAHECKEGDRPCQMCDCHKICTIKSVELCMKCDGKTYTGHYFKIVG